MPLLLPGPVHSLLERASITLHSVGAPLAASRSDAPPTTSVRSAESPAFFYDSSEQGAANFLSQLKRGLLRPSAEAPRGNSALSQSLTVPSRPRNRRGVTQSRNRKISKEPPYLHRVGADQRSVPSFPQLPHHGRI